MGKRANGARAAKRAQKHLQVGATLEVTIERILPGGLGLAHASGQTVMVALAAPGDHLRVSVERVRGHVVFASLVEIIAPSPVRVEPPCPYFGRCGGCDFQQLSYEAQLDAKVSIIRDCLRRIARLEPPADIPITRSPFAWRYRSRAAWQYDPLKRRLGYFERGTHRVCDVAECPVLVPRLEETLSTLRERMRNGLLPADVEEFQAVAGDDRAALAPPLDEAMTIETTRTIGAYRYRFSADGFFQINHDLLAPLIDAALTGAQGQTAIDLYCGAGLFTLPLATLFKRVIGVESNPAAIAYARRNLSDAGLTNATAECARVSHWLAAHAPTLAPVDYLLLDPPRTGAEEGAIGGILSLRPHRIVYVSCDPATLARDLKELIAGGYRLDTLAAFDMFPQTHHVETVAHLVGSGIK
jgi:23S rRNA (uracil1939-C5)-methyltransferase